MPAPRILVVDDDPDMLDLQLEALATRGYDVASARNGNEALESVDAHVPDLILLDMRMPIMDGWAFAKELRERHGRGIPIVVVTAAEDSKLRADEIGADADLGKPFELEDLYNVVADVVGEPG